KALEFWLRHSDARKSMTQTEKTRSSLSSGFATQMRGKSPTCRHAGPRYSQGLRPYCGQRPQLEGSVGPVSRRLTARQSGEASAEDPHWSQLLTGLSLLKTQLQIA